MEVSDDEDRAQAADFDAVENSEETTNETVFTKSEARTYSQCAVEIYISFMDWYNRLGRSTLPPFSPMRYYFPDSDTFEKFTCKETMSISDDQIDSSSCLFDKLPGTKYSVISCIASQYVVSTFEKRFEIDTYSPKGVFMNFLNAMNDIVRMFIVPLFNNIEIVSSNDNFMNDMQQRKRSFVIIITCINELTMPGLIREEIRLHKAETRNILDNLKNDTYGESEEMLAYFREKYELETIGKKARNYYDLTISLLRELSIDTSFIKSKNDLLNEFVSFSVLSTFEETYRSLFTKLTDDVEFLKVTYENYEKSNLHLVMIRNMMDIILSKMPNGTRRYVRCTRLIMRNDTNGPKADLIFGISYYSNLDVAEKAQIEHLTKRLAEKVFDVMNNYNPRERGDPNSRRPRPEDRENMFLSIFPRNHVQVKSFDEYDEYVDQFTDFTQIGVLKGFTDGTTEYSPIFLEKLKVVFNDILAIISPILGFEINERMYESAYNLPLFEPIDEDEFELKRVALTSSYVMNGSVVFSGKQQIKTTNNVLLLAALSLLARLKLGKYQLVSGTQLAISKGYKFKGLIPLTHQLYQKDLYEEGEKMPMDFLCLNLYFGTKIEQVHTRERHIDEIISSPDTADHPQGLSPDEIIFSPDDATRTKWLIVQILEAMEYMMPKIIKFPTNLIERAHIKVPKPGVVSMEKYPVAVGRKSMYAHSIGIPGKPSNCSDQGRIAIKAIQSLGFPYSSLRHVSFEMASRDNDDIVAKDHFDAMADIDYNAKKQHVNIVFETDITEKIYKEAKKCYDRIVEKLKHYGQTTQEFDEKFMNFWITEHNTFKTFIDIPNTRHVKYHLDYENDDDTISESYSKLFGELMCYIMQTNAKDLFFTFKINENEKNKLTFLIGKQGSLQKHSSTTDVATSVVQTEVALNTNGRANIFDNTSIDDILKLNGTTRIKVPELISSDYSPFYESYKILEKLEEDITVIEAVIVDMDDVIRKHLPDEYLKFYPTISKSDVTLFINRFKFSFTSAESKCKKAFFSCSVQEFAKTTQEFSEQYDEFNTLMAIAIGCVQLKSLENIIDAQRMFIPTLIDVENTKPGEINVTFGLFPILESSLLGWTNRT